MRIKRSSYWNLIYSLLGNKYTGLVLNKEGLKLLGITEKLIPFKKITVIPVGIHNAFTSQIILKLNDGERIQVAGLPKRELTPFINVTKDAWKNYWSSEIHNYHQQIKSLANVLSRLNKPKRYPAACLVEPYRLQTEQLISRLPANLHDLDQAQGIQEYMDSIRKFYKSSERIRNDSIALFSRQKIAEMTNFFDSIDKYPLTQAQREAVISDEDATLVLASAGSGKTSVITAKAAYLILSKTRKSKEILLIAYGSDAAKEMSERITKCCATKIDCRTFHNLAYGIIACVEGEKPPLADYASDDRKFVTHIRQILIELSSADKSIQKSLLNWFSEFSSPACSFWDFNSLSDYYSYIKSQELRTLNGERVKSYEELIIANWLCMNGIDYEYEPIYEHNLSTKGRKKYTPDFRLTNSGVYIEHFGVRKERTRNGQEILTTAPYIDRDQYLESMNWKRKVHADHNTILIETYSFEHAAGQLTSKLMQKLAAYEKATLIEPEQIIDKLAICGEFDSFSKILGTFLRHFKGAGLTIDQCRKKLTCHPKNRRETEFLNIFEAVYSSYQNKLRNYIDFDDMISRATQHVQSHRFQSPFRHLLIDEFQDVSRGRAKLLLALKRQHQDTRIFAVGDDWQSIYRFAGSDVQIMREFSQLFGGHFAGKNCIHNVIDLGQTFRSIDRIAQPARRFILKNSVQIKKSVMATSCTSQPAIHVLWSNRRQQEYSIRECLQRIALIEKNMSSSVLILGRYQHRFSTNISQMNMHHRNLAIEFKSVHASKGLEADHVIIVGANSGKYGFPSEIVDDPILNMVLPAKELFPHAEERRVFYVALTRARKSVTIIANELHPSSFVSELVNEDEYGIEVIGDQRKRKYHCVKCGGHLVFGKNSRYNCEHLGYCDASLPPCPTCGGLPVRSAPNSNLSQCGCGSTFFTCQKCADGWLIERKGKFGTFLGCVNYPRCDEVKSVNLKQESNRK